MGNFGCSSTTFDVGGFPYSQVCGRIKGYQFGITNAFYLFRKGIERQYVDGVSLTHGRSGGREHIWTFVARWTELGNNPDLRCPCDTSNYDRVPLFVGKDYFCESGVNSDWSGQHIFYPDDPLWD